MSVRRKVGGQEEAVAYGGVAMCVCVCRQPGDDIKMLVCDTCDKGYHTFCLRPAMTTIPKNGWKCKVCTSLLLLLLLLLPCSVSAVLSQV